MFSGIVETTAPIIKVIERPQMLSITIEKPNYFNDISRGDSISVNGVCLTVENFSENEFTFTIAAESLQITQWTLGALMNRRVNLERSMRLGDRVHGHLVTGHVDGLGRLIEKAQLGEAVRMVVEVPITLSRYLWQKGSIAMNGVSLTVNSVENEQIEVCLIPETLARTNLRDLEIGSLICLEVDYMAKALLRSHEVTAKFSGVAL
jgi:riboflavin synthase